MRYEPEHKTNTHRRIVKNASRQFRAKGLNGPGVATVMRASGLTVGGFYKHFRSKDDLLVEAIEESLEDMRERFLKAARQAPAGEGWKVLVKGYLSLEHCDNPDSGCPIPALAPEIARATPAVKKRVADIMKRHREQILPFMPGRNAAERERNLIIAMTAMNGAVSAARMTTDPVRKQRILATVRDHLLATL
jgi:TetR/AcrR family transcriptional repressor of nem operon